MGNNMETIMQLAQELGTALADSTAYQAYIQAQDALALDGATQDLLTRAEALRADLRGRLEGGTPPEELQDGLDKLREVNTALHSCQTLVAVNETRKEFDDLMNRVNTLLKYHVGGADDSCGGDCSGCSGCG